MSTLDVVAEILREVAPLALKARQIAERAGARLPTTSKTPETVVSRDLAIDVRDRGASSRFLRVDRGAFVLKEALPTAFYNDVDAYAAAWTRNLIAAGEIAEGVVDERSIRDLKPADVASYRQCHFFSGIGVWSRALRDAGWPDDVNVWSGSCPCGPWSQAGQKRGFSDEQHLWPEWHRLIAACRPSVVVGEQVSSKDGLAWLDLVLSDLEGADYSVRTIDTCAAGVGAPHLRQRLYFVAVARERGRQVVCAPWLHDLRQSGDDAARCREVDGGTSRDVSDAAGARRVVPEVAGADRGDACESPEARERGTSWDLELERGGDADGSRAVSDAERIVRDAGWLGGSSRRPEVEPDRHGEAHGVERVVSLVDANRVGCEGDAPAYDETGDGRITVGSQDDFGSVGLGDASLARGGRDAGALPRAKGVGEGEWIEAGDLADQPRAPGSVDGDERGGETMVRGAAAVAGNGSGFRPGDRIRLDVDPSWGGSVRGYWAEGVEWIYCRPAPGHQDGCWRPAESCTQPLVDEPAADMGRTRAARLRGYGNAIVREQAKEFVAAVIDSFIDAAREIRARAVVAEPVESPPSAEVTEMLAWTGPREGETAPSGMLYGRVPSERWPYGPPSAHEDCCNLFPHRGSPGGLFCDCAASAADDVDYGVGA